MKLLEFKTNNGPTQILLLPQPSQGAPTLPHLTQSLMQVVNLLFVVSSALAFWRYLVCVTYSESPLVVVLR